MQATTICLLLACAMGCEAPDKPGSGAGSGSAGATVRPEGRPDPDDYGDVAFKTFVSGGQRVAFLSRTKAEVTWANMAGPPVIGAWTKAGGEIRIEWDKAATHFGSRSERFHQMGPCSMARYERIDRKGGLHDDPMIYQQVQPRCDTVRVLR